jgi:hypothetical protein
MGYVKLPGNCAKGERDNLDFLLSLFLTRLIPPAVQSGNLMTFYFRRAAVDYRQNNSFKVHKQKTIK